MTSDPIQIIDPAKVIVYYTVFENIDTPVEEAYIKALPPAMSQEILLYKKQDDINRLTAGKYLLKKLLKDTGYDESLLTNYQIDEMGKPFIPGFHPFNISHSGRVVACAVLIGDGMLGIDLERIREIEVTKFTKQFSALEMMQILADEYSIPKFFDYWTMKESVMKADGRGMRIPLHSIRLKEDHATVDDKEHVWKLYPLQLHDSVKAHICCDKYLANIKTRIFSIQELCGL